MQVLEFNMVSIQFFVVATLALVSLCDTLPTARIHVGNLPVGNLDSIATQNALYDLFGKFGAVDDVKVIIDRDTGRSRGFGFVEFHSRNDMIKALAACHGAEINGRVIRCSESRPRARHISNGGGRRGYGGGEGGYGGYGGGQGGYGGGQGGYGGGQGGYGRGQGGYGRGQGGYGGYGGGQGGYGGGQGGYGGYGGGQGGYGRY